MSIKAMSWVWEHSEQKGTRLLILLALADRSDDFGECYPGLARLARKARCTKQTASKHIKALEEGGELSVIVHGGIKTTHGKTNKYYLKKYRDDRGLTTEDGNRSEYVTYDGVSKRIPQEVSDSIPQEVSDSIPYSLGDTSGDTSETDSPSPKSSDGGTQPLDDDGIQGLCIICHSSYRPGRPICKECLKAFNGVAYNKLDFVCTGCGKNIGPNEYHCDPTKNYRCLCVACYTTSQITGDDGSGALIDSTPLPLGTCSRCDKPCADDCSLCDSCAKTLAKAMDDDSSASDAQLTAEQKPTMTELADEILVPTSNDYLYSLPISDAAIIATLQAIQAGEGNVNPDAYEECENRELIVHGEITPGAYDLLEESSGPEQLPEMSEAETKKIMQSLSDSFRTDCMYMYQDAGCQRLRETTATCVGCEQFALDLDTPLNDQADAMLAIKDKMKSKHKRKAKSKRSEADKMAEDNMWEAVKFVWELDDKAGGLIGKYRQWLFGKIPASKAKQFGEMWYGNQLKDCPATAQEVVAFSHWYRFTKPGMSMPGKGDTLKDNFDAFRGSGKDYEAFLRKAEDTIRDKIPKFSSPGIELAREQALPEEEEEIMEATPELRAEVDRLIAMCGKGGVK